MQLEMFKKEKPKNIKKNNKNEDFNNSFNNFTTTLKAR